MSARGSGAVGGGAIAGVGSTRGAATQNRSIPTRSVATFRSRGVSLDMTPQAQQTTWWLAHRVGFGRCFPGASKPGNFKNRSFKTRFFSSFFPPVGTILKINRRPRRKISPGPTSDPANQKPKQQQRPGHGPCPVPTLSSRALQSPPAEGEGRR